MIFSTFVGFVAGGPLGAIVDAFQIAQPISATPLRQSK
jgi:hypothetical protein